MSVKQILWCQEGKHDKVWGIIELARPQSFYDNGKYVTFWGRRGAKLQTKVWEGRSFEADDMVRKKANKGYDEIDQSRLDEVYPEFQQDLEKTEFWSKLKM